jgi:hypothetical protein
MRKYKAGIEVKNRLLIYHLEGLLNIIIQLENNTIPKTVSISGTSYFFNERTLNKFGFEIKKPSLFYKINLFANFIDLIWMYSLSQGRLSIPKLWKANKASISGSKLMESKDAIDGLYIKISSKITQ